MAGACRGCGRPITRADLARRGRMRDLCNPKSTYAVREAAVAALEAVAKDYRAVRTAAGALASAFREYEETRAVLVELAVAYPFDALPLPEELGRTWEALADDFGKLQSALCAGRGAAAERRLSSSERRRACWPDARTSADRSRVTESGSVRQYENLLRWPHWSLAGARAVAGAAGRGGPGRGAEGARRLAEGAAQPRHADAVARGGELRSAACGGRSRSCGWPMCRARRT